MLGSLMGSIQWEHSRTWDLAATSSEFVLAEGALCLPGGFEDLSLFFRRRSQSGGEFRLHLWTTPAFYQPLDLDFSNGVEQYLFKLAWTKAGAMQMTGTAGKVFGGRVDPADPIGTLLFWQMENISGTREKITGDLFLVPNHAGTMSTPSISRPVPTEAGIGARLAPRSIRSNG